MNPSDSSAKDYLSPPTKQTRNAQKHHSQPLKRKQHRHQQRTYRDPRAQHYRRAGAIRSIQTPLLVHRFVILSRGLGGRARYGQYGAVGSRGRRRVRRPPRRQCAVRRIRRAFYADPVHGDKTGRVIALTTLSVLRAIEIAVLESGGDGGGAQKRCRTE